MKHLQHRRSSIAQAHFTTNRLGCWLVSVTLVLFLLSGCAITKEARDKAGEAMDATAKLAEERIKKLGELAIKLVDKQIDYVRGKLLHGETDNAGRTVLHYAVAANDLEEVKRLLDEGAPSKPDSEGYEPFHIAITRNNPELLEVFASYDHDIAKPTSKGVLPLQLAAFTDSVQSMHWLLKAGLDPLQEGIDDLNAIEYGINNNKSNFLEPLQKYTDLGADDPSRDSYIHYAAQKLNHGAIAKLIAYGVDADQLNREGLTPLMVAVARPRSEKIIQTLIENKAQLERKDPHGDTPLLRSIRNNFPKNLSILVDAKANPNVVDASGDLAIYIALNTGNGDHIKHLARAGTNLNQYDDDGFAPLHHATIDNQTKIIEPLVKYGAIVELPVKGLGTTAMMLSARLGHSKIQTTLQRLGASEDLTDIAGNTSLHYAAGFNHVKSITAALVRSANINATNLRGETPIHTAIYRNANSSLTRLLKNQPDLTIRDLRNNQPLHAALYTGNVTFVQQLLKKGVQVDSDNAEGELPINASINDNNLEMVKLLISHNASLIIADQNGRYPVHRAALLDRPEAIILLARGKSPMDPTDADGLTPLHLASAKGHFLSVRALLRNGAFINARNPQYRTPLHLAAAANQRNAAEELVQSGADAELRDIDLNTPIFTALEANAIDTFAPILRNTYPNLRDSQGNTALMAALLQNKMPAAYKLLQLGVSSQFGNFEGKTPLHLAFQMQNPKLLSELANDGADINMPLKTEGYDMCNIKVTENTATQITALDASARVAAIDTPAAIGEGNAQPITIAAAKETGDVEIHTVPETDAVTTTSDDEQTTTAEDEVGEAEKQEAVDANEEVTQNVSVVQTNGDAQEPSDDTETTATIAVSATAASEATADSNESATEPTGAMAEWQKNDCQIYLNDDSYLGKRARWLLLGRTKSYVASRWWYRIPLPPTRDPDTIAAITKDAQSKLNFYLSYSMPERFLSPLEPPTSPRFSNIKRQANESEAAYLERLDYYQKEYQDKYSRQLARYTKQKEHRLERIAQMQKLHRTLDIHPKRSAINYTADALQYHYNTAFRASNGVFNPAKGNFVIEIPVSDLQTIILRISEHEYPLYYDYFRREWRNILWYIGTVVTPDSFAFVEVATMTPNGVLFIPLNIEKQASLKVLVNKFNQFN